MPRSDYVANLALTANQRQFQKDMKGARQTWSKFGSDLNKQFKRVGVAGVAAAASLAAAFRSTSNYATEIKRSAQETGLAAREFQRLKFAIERVGGDVDEVATSILTLNERLADFKTRVGDDNPFARLGLDISKLQQLKPEEAFVQVVDALRQMESQSERTFAALEALGDTEGRIALRLAADFKDFRTELERAGEIGVIGDGALKSADDFTRAVNDISHAIRTGFANAILQGVNRGDEWTRQMRELREGVEAATRAVRTVIETAWEWREAIAGVAAAWALVRAGMFTVAAIGLVRKLGAAMLVLARGFKRARTALFLSPKGAVVLGLIAAGVAVAQLVKDSESLEGAWTRIKERIDQALAPLQGDTSAPLPTLGTGGRGGTLSFIDQQRIQIENMQRTLYAANREAAARAALDFEHAADSFEALGQTVSKSTQEITVETTEQAMQVQAALTSGTRAVLRFEGERRQAVIDTAKTVLDALDSENAARTEQAMRREEAARDELEQAKLQEEAKANAIAATVRDTINFAQEFPRLFADAYDRALERQRAYLTDLVAIAEDTSGAFRTSLRDALLTGNFRDIARATANAFKTSLADAIAGSITRRLFDPLINGLVSSLGNALGGLLGGSAAGALGIGAGAAAGGAAAGGGILAGVGGAISGAVAGLGSLLSSAAGAISGVISGIGSAISGIAAALGPGGIIVAGLAALAGSLFGRKEVGRTTELQVQISGAELAAALEQTITTERTGLSRIFGSKRRTTTNVTDLEGDDVADLQAAFASIREAVRSTAAEIGFSTTALDTFTGEFKLALEGLSETERESAITSAFADLAAQMSQAVLAANDINVPLADASQRLADLAEQSRQAASAATFSSTEIETASGTTTVALGSVGKALAQLASAASSAASSIAASAARAASSAAAAASSAASAAAAAATAAAGSTMDGLQEFRTGGIVAGPLGSPQLAVVHGGEEVLTPAQRSARGNTINVNMTLVGDVDAATVRAMRSRAREMAAIVQNELLTGGQA